MIASLRGIVKEIYENKAIVEVGGVGYEVRLTERECANLFTKKGIEVEIYTHYYLRENAAELYGFSKPEEREMFFILIGISGVGPKGALNVLNAAPLDILQRAIANGDTAVLTKVSGIGNKMAQKIVMELKDKFGHEWLDSTGSVRTEGDVVEALQTLGYARSQIHDVLKQIPESAQNTEDKLKEALKLLGRK